MAILYYIEFNISIDETYKYCIRYMCNLYIAFDIQKCYNYVKGGKGLLKSLAYGGDKMAVSKAQQRAVNKYMKENYDVYQIRMPKGKKEVIKAHASGQCESLNGFINRAIDETMERDK